MCGFCDPVASRVFPRALPRSTTRPFLWQVSLSNMAPLKMSSKAFSISREVLKGHHLRVGGSAGVGAGVPPAESWPQVQDTPQWLSNALGIPLLFLDLLGRTDLQVITQISECVRRAPVDTTALNNYECFRMSKSTHNRLICCKNKCCVCIFWRILSAECSDKKAHMWWLLLG